MRNHLHGRCDVERMTKQEKAIREAQKEFRYHWPAFNRWWTERRTDLGLTDMEDMPLGPFEAAVDTYQREMKK